MFCVLPGTGAFLFPERFILVACCFFDSSCLRHFINRLILFLNLFSFSAVNLTYDVFDGKGESTPLVFLHGLFGSKSNFHSIAKSLVQRTGRKVMQ